MAKEPKEVQEAKEAQEAKEKEAKETEYKDLHLSLFGLFGLLSKTIWPARRADYILDMISSPNSEHFNNVAPSIRRWKS